MGILDRAKQQLENRFKGVGEETVRVMDAVRDEPKEKLHKEKPAPVPKQAKEKPVKEKSEFFNLKNKITSRISSDDEKTVREEPASKPAPKPRKAEEKYDEERGSSAFDVDEEVEESYFGNMSKRHKQKMKQYEQVPVPIVDEGKIQDILELLKIPSTYEIESDIFLPDDLDEIGFDLQVPQGYETSEVDVFVSRVKVSVAKYVELLNSRNEHIAKLASVVDRLQVDITNIKLQSEIANGINIMPTNDTEHLEQENYELKAIIKRLEESIETDIDDSLTSKERETFEELQDKVSLQERQIKDAEEEIAMLKSQLDYMEEQDDLLMQPDQPQEARTTDTASYNGNYVDYDENSDDSSLPDFDELPELDNDTEDDFDELPDLGDVNFSNANNRRTISGSAFEEAEEPLESFLMRNQEYYQGNNEEEDESYISVLDDNGSSQNSPMIGSYFDDDDEEDELDKLQNWSN